MVKDYNTWIPSAHENIQIKSNHAASLFMSRDQLWMFTGKNTRCPVCAYLERQQNETPTDEKLNEIILLEIQKMRNRINYNR